LLHTYGNAEICKQITECTQNVFLRNSVLGIAGIHPIFCGFSKMTISSTSLKDVKCLHTFLGPYHRYMPFAAYHLPSPGWGAYKWLTSVLKWQLIGMCLLKCTV